MFEKILRILLNLPANESASYGGRDLSGQCKGTINYGLKHGLDKAKLKRRQQLKGQEVGR